jgi:hypothetical protein
VAHQERSGLDVIRTTNAQVYLSEVADTEPTDRGVRIHRLPPWVRAQFPDPQLLAMEAQPSGVRLTFRTAATRIELDVHATRIAYVGTSRPRGRIDLVVDGVRSGSSDLTGGSAFETDLAAGTTTVHDGPPHTAVFTGLPPREKTVELWLPHNESIELGELRSDAALAPSAAAGPLWVHHGSSISHGSNAVGPTEIWPAVAARTSGVRLQNLGLGGSALLDPFLARTMRDSDADLLSVKVGINVVNLDVMRLRAFVPALHGFLDTIRDGHPTTPLLLVSPIFCGIQEDTPGPLSIDPATLGTEHVRFIATGEPGDTRGGRLTLRVIREAMARVAEVRADPQLHLIDGLTLYGPADAVDLPLPDGLHPDSAAHERIGERFSRVLERYRADRGPA